MLTWREIRASHKWFHEYDPKSFQRYIRDLRRANPEKVALIAEEKNLKDSPINTNRASFARRCQGRRWSILKPGNP
jgi:hypothetical protein